MKVKRKDIAWDKKMLVGAVKASFIKLSPKVQMQHPVIFLVYLSALLTTWIFILSLFGADGSESRSTLAIAAILWFTVMFINFMESMAGGDGKLQNESLRSDKKDVENRNVPWHSQDR